MILPIVAYGNPILRKKCNPIKKEHPNLEMIIKDMFQTLDNALGIGLAAPQVGMNIRMFIVDAFHFSKDENIPEEEREKLKKIRKVFINPKIIKEEGELWKYSEGCLSIPNIYEYVERHSEITITYVNENFNEHTEKYDGMVARIIQHEYDHVEGILFTDKLSSFRKKMIKSKLKKIEKGILNADYPMVS